MHPILFKIGPFELYTYGALLAIAFLAAIYLAAKQAEREGLNPEFASDMGIVVILSSIVGARLFFILFYDLQNTLNNPAGLFKLRQTGLVFYGGLIFAVAAGLAYSKMKKVSLPVVLDIAAPSIAIGQAIGRIGCLMSGCCYGRATQVSWAVTLPYLGHPTHPTQIYESLTMLVIFLGLIWFRKRKTRNGQVAWLYLVMYASARFVIEFYRGDNPQILMGLTVSQVISLVALIGAIPLGYLVWLAADHKQADGNADRKAV